MPVAEPVARFLSRLPARTVQVVRVALRLFEWLPFPWRFSRLGVEARSEYLAKLERSRFAPYRDLLLLAKLLAMIGWARDERVRAAIGYEARCAVREGTSPPRTPPLGDLRPSGEGEECDVAIVGSGAGGAAAAAVLAEAGLDVLVLESGPHVDHTSYPSDPLDGLPLLYRDGGMTIASGKPAIPVPVGRAVGGTTVINSGTCFRAPAEVLREWADAGIAWATELDPLYEQAERVLAVTPVDPERMGRNGQLCMEGAAALGASGGPIARNAGACVQCSSCPLGCRIDAKRAAHVSLSAAGGGCAGPGSGPGCRSSGCSPRARGSPDSTAGPGCRRRPPRSRPERPAGARPRLAGASKDRDRRRRRLRHPRATAALRDRRTRQLGRHLHIHPAAWIGARYAGGGARLGGDHAELLRRRVAGAADPSRGDLHPALLRRPVAARRRGGVRRPRPQLRPRSPRSASTFTTGPRGGSG